MSLIVILSETLQATQQSVATPLQIRNAVDTRLAQLWTLIQSHQAVYFANHGVYWQGIGTPTQVPQDGNGALVDFTVHPVYQSDDWSAADFATIPSTLPMMIEVHQHIAPDGFGFTGIATVVISSATWKRAQGVGPGSVTFGWTQVSS